MFYVWTTSLIYVNGVSAEMKNKLLFYADDSVENSTSEDLSKWFIDNASAMYLGKTVSDVFGKNLS